MTMSGTSVATAHASRYLQQLCKHWSHKFETQFDEKAGTIRFDADRAVALTADEEVLRMQLTTPDAETNLRLQAVVAEHLKRFAFREELAVDWAQASQKPKGRQEQDPMITVHHLNNSRSQRVLWLLEELAIDYEVKRYERTKTLQAPEAMKKVHPLGKSPILTDGDTTVAETGAIVEYILSRHGGGRLMPPEGTADYWQARHFLHYAEGSAMPPLFLMLILSMIPDRAPFFAKPILKASMAKVDEMLVKPQIQLHMDHWENSLAKTGWFAGPEMSVADVMMSFPVEAAATRVGYEERPRLRDFLQLIHERPAYKRGLKRGGPYAYA